MNAPTPVFLLNNPELVLNEAPWCTWLDNLEVAILMLAQPWLAGGGLRRSELEQQLSKIVENLPLGQIYFQRVSRSVAQLLKRGQLSCSGASRHRRFRVTAEGFAALLLNLQVLRCDPTVDGAEFELKRSLVAIWNQVMNQVSPDEEGPEPGQDLGHLFVDLEHLEVLGHPVVSDEIVREAFDILRLVDAQRQQVGLYLHRAELQLHQADVRRGMLDRVAAGSGVSMEVAAQRAKIVASAIAPSLEATAAVLRYQAYLAYLDDLDSLYANEFSGG